MARNDASPVGRITLAAGFVALVAMLGMPWWADSGTTRSIIEFSCYLALAQMWNLLAGYAGLVSVGQQAFIGVAGYTVFAAANHFGVDPFAAVALSVPATALIAVLSYGLLRRLDGPYFAIGTWVVAEVCRLMVSNSEWLGSSSGMTLRAMQKYAPEVRETGVLWLAGLMLLLTVGGTSWLLTRSRYGLALRAMRDDRLAAGSQGVDVRRLKLAIYVAAAVGTGLVGSVYYLNTLRLSPNAGFDPNWTSIMIFMVMVGGIGTLRGPWIGAVIYFAADRLFSDYGASYMIVLGVLTVIVAVFARSGIGGMVTGRFDVQRLLARRRRAPECDRPELVRD